MAKKPTKRKAFNFLRSYYDVLNELGNDKDKLNFLLAILNKQFTDEDPNGLNFIVNICCLCGNPNFCICCFTTYLSRVSYR